MRLSVNEQNLIVVEDAKKEDVDFIIVDNVFFKRVNNAFCNITNDNMNGYEVKISSTDSIYLELEITTHKDTGKVFIIVEDINRQHSKILFEPKIVDNSK